MQPDQFGNPKLHKSLIGISAMLSKCDRKTKAHISAALHSYNRSLSTIEYSKLSNGFKRKLYLLLRNEARDRLRASVSFQRCEKDLQTHLMSFMTGKVTRLLRGEKKS